MFNLSPRQLSTIFIVVFIGFTKLMTSLFPDLFPENEWIVYQVWTVAIWLFVMFLPKNVGSAFKQFFNKYIKKDFLSIHIDYKWDQYDLNIERFNSLLKKISFKTNIVISSGIEGSKFFEKLKKNDKFLTNLIFDSILTLQLKENQ